MGVLTGTSASKLKGSAAHTQSKRSPAIIFADVIGLQPPLHPYPLLTARLSESQAPINASGVHGSPCPSNPVIYSVDDSPANVPSPVGGIIRAHICIFQRDNAASPCCASIKIGHAKLSIIARAQVYGAHTCLNALPSRCQTTIPATTTNMSTMPKPIPLTNAELLKKSRNAQRHRRLRM